MPLYKQLGRDMKKNRQVYFMLIPVALFYLIFCYIPMFGLVLAFKEYSPGLGVLRSPWVWFENFEYFFSNPSAWRTIKNTIVLGVEQIVFGFPVPIILALMINELQWPWLKKIIQTISYMPHFVSLVVVCGIIIDFVARDGVINQVLSLFGVEPTAMLMHPEYFRPVFIISGIWQTAGWSSIVYLSAISAIDPGLYEAATVDGAGRFKRIWYVTLPGIAPTITVLFIMRVGNVMNIGYEKVILLYNSMTMETADIISSFVYRVGLLEGNYGLSTAVGIFNSAINLLFLFAANFVSRKVSETSLW